MAKLTGVVLALLNLTFHLKGGKSEKNHFLSFKEPGAPFHITSASVKANVRSVKHPLDYNEAMRFILFIGFHLH